MSLTRSLVCALALGVGVIAAGSALSANPLIEARHGGIQAVDIAGEWDVAMNTPGGTSNFKVIFKVDGEKITGEVRRASGTLPITGTIKGSDLQFAYAVRYNDNDVVVTLTGKVSGNRMGGSVDFNGNAQDEWSATRTAK